MNWEAISAIADTLGAAGVIITVIYLAIQIRHNTRSVQAATEQTLMSQEIEVYALTAAHAYVYQRGCNDLEGLDPADRVVFDNVLFANMSQLYSGWVQFKRRLIPLHVWQAYRNSAVYTLSDKGFLDAWNEIKFTYPVDFQAIVEDLLEKGEVH